MNQVIVNGVTKDMPLNSSWMVMEALDFIKRKITSESVLISSIKLDGRELLVDENLSASPLSAVGKIEIETSHPREVVDDTIQYLIVFAGQVSMLSRDVAECVRTNAPVERVEPIFVKLVDGIRTFVEAVAAIKKVLKLGNHQHLGVLEADLASILSDLLEARRANDNEYAYALMHKYLPENFEQWISSGLNGLMRVRDS